MPFGFGKKGSPPPPSSPARRTLEELIDPDDAWADIQDWLSQAARPVELLPTQPEAGERTLLAVQVTTHSMLGTIAFRTGGILVDRGWLRILGSGHARVGGGLREWNSSLGGDPLDPPVTKALIVGYDVLGGFFALNGGEWPGDLGLVHYFAPDTRGWEPMAVVYSEFLAWAMSNRLDGFYEGQRWSGWENEMAAVGPDQVLSIAPPLGLEPRADRRTPIGERDRRPVSGRSAWSFSNEIGRQLASAPDGKKVRFRFE